MKLEITSTQNTIRFAGDLDIYGAGTALHALCDHLAARPAMELDLGAVTACDAAGLQLLLAAWRSAYATGKPFAVAVNAPVVEQCARKLGLGPDLWPPKAL